MSRLLRKSCNSVARSGAWSIVAPFVFGYQSTIEVARNSDVVVGIAVALIALVGHFYVSPVTREGHRLI